MNTFKSATVLLVLAGVLYGVYTVLNKPEPPPPAGMTARDVQQMGPPQVELNLPPTGLPAPPTSLAGPTEGTSPADLTPASAEYPLPDSSAPTGLRSSYESPVDAGPSDPAPADTASVTIEPATPAPSYSAVNALSFRRDLQTAEQQVGEGKFRSALALLSPYYSVTDLQPDERRDLLAWLDALAGKVIYSREHLLDGPHQVRKGELLFDVADKYRVPWQLLANINGVSDPQVLVPSTELKVVPGPFGAEVNLTTSELTLFLGELYAGRFSFVLGNEPPQPGEYKVLDRRRDRTYYGPDGRTIPANDRTNPYGQWWLDLGREACIHGSPDVPANQTLGCISLSPQDAKDVYGILVVGSPVIIR
ncbi:MAG: L,D-transpeptidase family protein [Pirellulaceae bacterium]|nr:L,D-transpeptidase family protein [Pirellulaceae bacterium]